MTSKRTCILHIHGKTTEEVKPFDDNTWRKVNSVHEKRHSTVKDSKYFRISLPAEYDQTTGYHKQCYKDFTALSIANVEQDSAGPSRSHVLRSEVEHTEASSTGIFEKKCLFCNSITKSLGKGKREVLGTCMTDMGEESIKNAAELAQDNVMLAKLGGLDMKAKEVRYHHSCRRNYIHHCQTAVQKDDDMMSSKLAAHKAAFQELQKHIDVTLVSNQGAEYLSSLHVRYLTLLGDDETTYPARSLADKILKTYPNELTSHCVSRKTGTIIHNANLSQDAAIRRANFDDHAVQEAAFYLRSLILKVQSAQDDLPRPITTEALEVGQADPPDAVLEFFRVLYTGSNKPPWDERIERLVKSVSDDVLYVTTRARIKPGKHLCMGLALKSMTGSRKVVEILNRFGHGVELSHSRGPRDRISH